MKIWAEYVCMFENPLPVMENETYTLKHTRLSVYVWKISKKSRCVSVYVWACMFHFPWTGRGFSNIHAHNIRKIATIFLIFSWWLSVYVWAFFQWHGFQTYIHAKPIFSFANEHSFYACMFAQHVCLSFRWQACDVFKHTYMLISLIVDSILADFASSMYVCLRASCMLGDIHAPQQISKHYIVVQILNRGFSWGMGPHPCMIIQGLKHTSIHTYMLGDIHTCIHTPDIHTCSQGWVKHTYTLSDFKHLMHAIQFFQTYIHDTFGGTSERPQTYIHA